MAPLVIIDLLIGTFQTFYKISTSAPPKLRAPTFKEQFSMIAPVIFWQSSSFNNSDVTEKYLRSNIWLSSWIYHWPCVFQGLFCILHMVCHFFSSFWLIYRTLNLWTSQDFYVPRLDLKVPKSSELTDNGRSNHSEVLLGKGILKVCSKFTGEHPYWSAISIKLQITLRHGCSPVNSLHIFRTPFPKNTSGPLLLQWEE